MNTATTNATATPADPPPGPADAGSPGADRLAVALEWLDNPRGFRLDAMEETIRALALARAEMESDLSVIRGVLHRIDRRLGELGAMTQEIQAWREKEFIDDGR